MNYGLQDLEVHVAEDGLEGGGAEAEQVLLGRRLAVIDVAHVADRDGQGAASIRERAVSGVELRGVERVVREASLLEDAEAVLDPGFEKIFRCKNS